MINAFVAWACIFFRILVICIFIHDSKSPRFLIYVVVCLMSIRI
jgi:uncharacterized MAPEG superfamily protein